MPKLHVIIASTRPGRIGLPIATWFDGFARQHGKFDVRLVDLAEVNLPIFNEPKHPRFQQYEHAHTKAWSATVAEADAFVVVTPEYNHSAPPSLFNALDYLFNEWHFKAVGLVSYGGVAGGARAQQMIKATLSALRMVPMPEAVTMPMAAQYLEAGVFKATDAHTSAAKTMLDELARWTPALQSLRHPPA